MTVLRMLQMYRHAWYVVVFGLLATGLAVSWVSGLPGVYYGQADVVFLRPANRIVPNGLSVNSSSVIATVGVVERDVNGGFHATRVVSEQVTILGTGMRSGSSVRLPNSGGQWANNFDRAVLDVQVVDVTAAAAQERLDDAVRRIESSLATLQDEAGVRAADRIRTQLSPAVPRVAYRTGNAKRAAAMTGVLGLSITWSALVLLEARSRRRTSRGGEDDLAATDNTGRRTGATHGRTREVGIA